MRWVDIRVRFCPLCDALLLGPLPLCRYCANLIREEVYATPMVHDREKDLSILSLFRWKKDSPGFLSELIYTLKGGGHSDLQAWLAHLFWTKNHPLIRRGSRVFVPAPAAVPASDHAATWAGSLALSSMRGLYWSPLIRTQGVQKRKSQVERGGVRLAERGARISDQERLWSQREVVFCDDIVTTGSTALAAFEALGRPPQFRVWALAYRLKETPCQKGQIPLLSGASKVRQTKGVTHFPTDF